MSERLAGDGLWATWNVRLTLLATAAERPPRKMFAVTPVALTMKSEKLRVPRSHPAAPSPVTLPAFTQEGIASARDGPAMLPPTTSATRTSATNFPICDLLEIRDHRRERASDVPRAPPRGGDVECRARRNVSR